MMAKHTSWCHLHVIVTLQLKLNKRQIIKAITVFSTHICDVGRKRVNRGDHLIEVKFTVNRGTDFGEFEKCPFNRG